MKTLLLGIVLIVLLGVAGFFYRNVMETVGSPEPVACTMDAKICPDGSSVGRVAPLCEFAACPTRDITFVDFNVSIALPEGYTQEPYGEPKKYILDNFLKPSASDSSWHVISLYSYPIEQGKTAEEVILANTRYQPADMQAEDFERFETETIQGQTFRVTVVERFEAVVHSAYFLARENDVLMFEIVEHDVADWMEPELVVEELPEHQALRGMLETLQIGE